MKKQLLFDIKKMSFKIAALAFFILLTVQSSFAQTWPIVSNENAVSSVASTHTSLLVLNESGNEIPYVAYVEIITAASSGIPATGIAKVKKRLTNGTWVQVGPNLSNSGSSFTRIYANTNGDLYVAYIDGTAGSKLVVKKFNTTTQVWDTVGGTGVYVSTGSATNTVSQFKEAVRHSMAFDSANNPYIAYIEASGLVPTVKKFDGTNWVTQGSTIINSITTLAEIAHAVNLVIDEADMPWLAFTSMSTTTSTGGSMALYKFTGGTWTAAAASPATSARHNTITLTSTGNLAIVYFDTTSGTGLNRATAIEYNKAGNTWGSITRLGSRDSVNISLIKDSSGNLYCSFVDAVTSAFLQSARAFKQDAGGTTWTELKDPNVIRGVDEPTGWASIAVANGSTVPYLVYTKANLAANIVTPIVRKFAPLVGTPPVITGFTPTFAAASPPAPSVAFTITGTNFTDATAVTFGGNPVDSFTVVSATSITGTTSASAIVNSSVSVTTPNGIATATAPSALSYAAVPSTYNGTPLFPTVTAPATLAYSIAPTLPAGMSFNLGTGAIGGSPTANVASTTYTITASNAFGNTTTTVTFAAQLGPTALSYSPAASASYTTGTAITPLVATITANGGTPIYTVAPSFPAGIVLDPNTGGISGTPTAVTASTVYTVTATTAYGYTTRVLTFSTTAPLAIDSFEKSDAVKAYPNPTTDTVTVSLPNGVAVEKIAVYNNLGQLVLTEAKNTVSLQQLNNGTYFLTIYTSEGNFSKKIIKK